MLTIKDLGVPSDRARNDGRNRFELNQNRAKGLQLPRIMFPGYFR